ncbi:MAG: peptidase S8 [Lachnospiraceae bacterium]|nr:peptidase S8 [Lachnospiraceae bacterium]
MEKVELIIKYSGDIDYIIEEIDVIIEKLSYGYAIVVLDIELVSELYRYSQIEYIEEPRRLFFSANEGKAVSCINSVQRNDVSGLFGEGVLIAIIDSGIDYNHMDFRNEDGSSRIIYIWDQTETGKPPEGFILGAEYNNEQINEALQYTTFEEQQKIVRSVDYSGHGTHVAGIACGNGRESNGVYRGVAPRSEMIIVKIGDSIGNSYPSTSRLMEGLEYVMRIAIKENKPIAINLSFGNNYGDHAGNSLVELYINEIALTWKNNICIGVGNDGNKGLHASGIFEGKVERIELSIGANQKYVSIQLWKSLKDMVALNVQTPSGEILVIEENLIAYNVNIENYTIYVYYGKTTPLNENQEINIILYPQGDFLGEGIWILEMTPQNIINGRYDIWLGSDTQLNQNTRFLNSDIYKTITIPATAYRGIAVGAYNGRNDVFASFSGRGSYEYEILGKPEIVAPGVDIISTKSGGGYETRTGTSMATPFVTGSVALMHEWGIVRNNDREFYGQKVKAYLIKGARKLEGYNEYPNGTVGWGALCLEESIP